jgi:hypothetical protein
LDDHQRLRPPAGRKLEFAALAGAKAPDVATLVVPWTSPVWLALTLTLTVFCTLESFSITNTWQPKITAAEAGPIHCVEPIFGSVMARIFCERESITRTKQRRFTCSCAAG